MKRSKRSSLGKLLLHGFERGSRLRAKKRRAQRRAAPRARQKVPARKPAPEVLASKEVAAPISVPIAPAHPAPTQDLGARLSTQNLIRPDDRLRQSIEGFLLDQRSEHTRRAYAKDMKRFVRYLLVRREERGVEGLDRTVLIGYKDYLLTEKLEHTTVDRHLATLRSFFRWLVDDGVLEKNPAQGVRFLNPRKLSTTRGFSDEEVKKVLALPNLHTRIGAQHYAILMILFYCGLRRSELCSLRTSSIGRERSHAVIRLKGKGNAERVLVVVPPVWRAIEHYLKIARKDLSLDQPLFSPIRNNRTGVSGKPLDPSMIFYIVKRYAKEAGIAHRVSPHSCRATAISNARDHQVPDRAIQEFAGWASANMITRYDKRKTAVEESAAHAIRYGSENRPIPEAPKETSRTDLPKEPSVDYAFGRTEVLEAES